MPGSRLPGALALLRWMADPAGTFARDFARFGDVYSVQNPMLGTEVVVNEPELIRTILNGTDQFVIGEAARSIEAVVGPRSILVLDGGAHHQERKLLMPPFFGERMGRYAAVMRAATERAIAGWPRDARFSILPSMQRITFDVILRTVFGVRDCAEIDALRGPLVSFMERIQSPLGMIWLMPAFRKNLGPLTGWAAIERSLRVPRTSRSAAFITRARADASAAGRDDVLSLLLGAVHEGGGAMTDDEIRDELVTLLLAGHETTATALAWAFEEILRRPEVLATIIREELAGGGGAALERANLPYLDATIKEVLRLRPLTSLLVRRATDAVTLGGFAIPAGRYVVPCIYNAQRHPDHWKDPDAFSPERFLGEKCHPCAWMPFGAGGAALHRNGVRAP